MATIEEIKAGIESAIQTAEKAPLEGAKEELGKLSVASVVELVQQAIDAIAGLSEASQEVPTAQIGENSEQSAETVRRVTEGSSNELVTSMIDHLNQMGELGRDNANEALGSYRQTLEDSSGVLRSVIDTLQEEATGHLTAADGHFDEAIAGRDGAIDDGRNYSATL